MPTTERSFDAFRSQLTKNPAISHLESSKTGERIDATFERPVGLHDGFPVVVRYRRPEGQGTWIDVTRATAPGMWRYSPLLPVHGVPDDFAGDVGQTPLLRIRPLPDLEPLELFMKDEGQNPSGSFKDRGLAMGIALGALCRAKRFCLPTQGNAGVAASLYSARAGLPPALVYMPEGHRGSIYARAAAGFGAEVRFFGKQIAEAGKRMRSDLQKELEEGTFVDLSTFFEPGRLEGKKTMGLEIAEHFGADALPDAILYPTGGGTGLVGIHKAFRELLAWGALPATTKLPRMVAVQSDACAPVVRAFEKGLSAVEPVTSQGTIADGLDVPGAIMGHSMLHTLRESNGTAIAVAEGSIESTQRELVARGLCVSYEGAALFRAARDLLARGDLQAGDRVLLLNTASHLISMGSARAQLEG